MAYVPNTPISPLVKAFYGFAQQLKFALLQGDGVTPLDISAWNQIRMFTLIKADNGYRIDLGSLTVTATFDGTNTVLTLSAANINTIITTFQPENRYYLLEARNTSGDDFQVMAQGVFQFSRPS